jgi:uncharacterized membrane protein
LSDAAKPAKQQPGEVLDADTPAIPIAGEVRQIEVRSSPYPPPHDLQQYENILPGFTERILSLTERESEHRIQEERQQTRATIDLARSGQKYAFVLVLAMIGVGGAGILTGHSVVGLGGVIAAAATVVTAFVAPNVFNRLGQRKRKPKESGQLPAGEDLEQQP